jgi:hypothetical protein
MVGVYSLGQSSWSLGRSSSAKYPMANCNFNRLQDTAEISNNLDTPGYRQWPWRGFAFCSDLGTVGYLANKPKLGILGWILATPYYVLTLFKQPPGKERRQELIYQATANGFFPFVEAKTGVMLGGLLHQHVFIPFINKNSVSALSRLTLPPSKIAGGLTTLLTLTPTVGDPLSHWIIKQYKTHLKKDKPE